MYLALVLVGIFARLFLENSISTASLAKTNFHQHFIFIFIQDSSINQYQYQLWSSEMNCTRCVGSRDLQIGSFINPTAEWVASNVVTFVFLRFILVKASVEQDQSNSPFC